MAFSLLMATCIGCGSQFSANPHLVPSVRVNGEKEPLCRSCAARLHRHQTERGMNPPPIHPRAYEPAEEL